MVDFDVILSIDWLALYHVVLDCYAKIMTLVLPVVPRIAWRVCFIWVLRELYLFFRIIGWLKGDVYLIYLIFMILHESVSLWMFSLLICVVCLLIMILTLLLMLSQAPILFLFLLIGWAIKGSIARVIR